MLDQKWLLKYLSKIELIEEPQSVKEYFKGNQFLSISLNFSEDSFIYQQP